MQKYDQRQLQNLPSIDNYLQEKENPNKHLLQEKG
jgi:hypothetical protein